MPAAYTPKAPAAPGTDDYRCFLLDPHVDQDVWLTGSNVLPGNPDVVHHVILFKISPDSVAAAEAKDASDADQGWTCFGGTGIAGEFGDLEDANWLAAWAPGGDETKVQDGYGVKLEAGSRIVMQVHYNLLKGAAPDTSAAQLRWMPASKDLTSLHTFLMPAPVELPCRADHSEGPLCDRDAAAIDVKKRFGQAGNTNTLLHLLCGTEIEPSETTSCTRTISRGMTVLGVAGHMHLLGRKITIESNPGTDQAKTLLRIPVWDFDNQGSKPIDAVHLDAGDTVRVTCQHQQWLRDKLPAFETQREDRYVMWAEGSTDEMCLGLLQVAYD
jgi:Copper type II ascorbate-dependent monooxygenase, C-terminal domain